MKTLNIILKGLSLFIILNLLFAFFPPAMGKLSAYNILFPGRERLPFGENSAEAYNLSLFDLDAMFASHKINGDEKQDDDFRVILIGDSSVWGTLLKPEETLAGQLNSAKISACGKNVRVYNLGYPTISLTKDLLLLSRALEYQPDLVIWLTTLEAFPMEKQIASPLVANNEESLLRLANSSGLKVDANDPAFSRDSFWESTIIGKQRALADVFRLQIYGVMWAATGIDQVYPPDYEPAQTDLEADQKFHGFEPPVLDKNSLALNALETGIKMAGDTPIVIVNEPMMISAGKNSDIRYNFFYPRWAYDQYRSMMSELSLKNNWAYVDLWDAVPAGEFTNSAIHLTPQGEAVLTWKIAPVITAACK
ncbi:MAG: SGNH/GDSL hydrolase family protein [Chloroflexi bacterium]|nr:SGNH/GDSL hydrolase family protein [Chloroflexota bacterium]